MIILGIVCIIISVFGYAFVDVPLYMIYLADAVVKIAFGASLSFI